jgi:HD-like signal output (HDOD) protein
MPDGATKQAVHDSAVHATAGTSPSPRNVERILNRIESLPTLSTVASRMLRLDNAESLETREVIRVIESDPALTAKVLSICSRADKAFVEKITTVKRAVVMLGLNTIRNSVLSADVVSVMRRAAGSASESESGVFDHEGFWRHSIAVGCASELIAAKARGVAPDEAFVAGLLHNLGRLALDVVLPQAYAGVLMLAEQRCADTTAYERAIFGLDHHDAGRRLVETWGLPDSLGDVVYFVGRAEEPPADRHQRLVTVVAMAQRLCDSLSLGWSGNFGPIGPMSGLISRLSLPHNVLDDLTPKLLVLLGERLETLGLVQEGAGSLAAVEALRRCSRTISKLHSSILESRGAAAASPGFDAVREFCARADDAQEEELYRMFLAAASKVTARDPASGDADASLVVGLISQSSPDAATVTCRLADRSWEVAPPAGGLSELTRLAASADEPSPIPAATKVWIASQFGAKGTTVVRIADRAATSTGYLVLTDSARSRANFAELRPLIWCFRQTWQDMIWRRSVANLLGRSAKAADAAGYLSAIIAKSEQLALTLLDPAMRDTAKAITVLARDLSARAPRQAAPPPKPDKAL